LQSPAQCAPARPSNWKCHAACEAPPSRIQKCHGENKSVKKAYRELWQIACQTLTQAQQVHVALKGDSDPQALRMVDQLAEFIPLVEQVIAQATQRVLEEHSVPAAAKVVSLFEPHTQVLRRGKAPPRDTEFGAQGQLCRSRRWVCQRLASDRTRQPLRCGAFARHLAPALQTL